MHVEYCVACKACILGDGRQIENKWTMTPALVTVYTEHTQNNGTVNTQITTTPHHYFVYALYLLLNVARPIAAVSVDVRGTLHARSKPTSRHNKIMALILYSPCILCKLKLKLKPTTSNRYTPNTHNTLYTITNNYYTIICVY
jgi:hypothetical protein